MDLLEALTWVWRVSITGTLVILALLLVEKNDVDDNEGIVSHRTIVSDVVPLPDFVRSNVDVVDGENE